MTVSDEIDLTAKLEADRHSFVMLTEQLKAYGRHLTEHTQELMHQYDNFEMTHPLPPEATAELRQQFIATRERICVQLFTRHEAAENQHRAVIELLTQAKKAHQEINIALAQGSQGGQSALLNDLTERVERIATKARQSLEKYQTEKAATESLPPPNRESLDDKKVMAKTRRTYLDFATAELEAFVRIMSEKKPNIPPITALINYLEYHDERELEVQTLHSQALAAVQNKSPMTTFKKLFKRKTDKDNTPPSPIEGLICHAQNKLADILAETAIDISQPISGKPPLNQSYPQGNLYTLQEQYQTALQTELARQKQSDLLPLYELQSRQDAMEHRQAFLVLSISKLEFKLENIQPQKNELDILLDAISNMTPSDALDHLDDNEETIADVSHWFDATTEFTVQSGQELHVIYTAQGVQWLELQALYASINVPIPTDVTHQKNTLELEYQTLENRIITTNRRYQELQQSTHTLAAQTKALQLQKLEMIINECNEIINQIPEEITVLTRPEKIQLIASIEEQIQALADQTDFFTKLTVIQDQEIENKLTVITTSQTTLERSKNELVQSLLSQTNNTPPEPKEQLSTLFFGPRQPAEIGGIFGAYLKERASTFWFRDLCSQFASLIIGCCGYQTEATLRIEYISSLRENVEHYENDTLSSLELQAIITEGLQRFPPRSTKNPEYQKSLHAKLMELQTKLRTSPTPVPNQEFVISTMHC